MRSMFAISALAVGIAIAATSLGTPATAQYGPVYGPRYYGPGPYGPAYPPNAFRGPYYYRGPTIEPFFYGDGWVPEPIFDHSRPGGIDPTIRPSP